MLSRNRASSASVIGFWLSNSRVEWRSRKSAAVGDNAAVAAEFAQIDLGSGPRRANGRQRSDRVRVRISAAQRVGVAALGAARVEHKIVEVPQHEGVVALGRPQAIAGGLEKDLAVDEQREKLEPRKILLPAELFDLLRRGQQGQSNRDLRIADFEQGAGTRQFQNHSVGAPPHIGKPRKHQSIGVAELRQARPIVRQLRLDDDQILVSRAPEAVLDETAPGQSPDEDQDFLIGFAVAGRKRAQRQTDVQSLGALGCFRAEFSKAERNVVEPRNDVAACLRLQRDVAQEPCGQRCRCASPILFSRSAHDGAASGMRMKRIELAFRDRRVAQAELDRHVVKPAGPETAIEMAQARNDDADHRRLDVGPGLIEHQEIEAGALGDVHASQSLLARVEAAEFHIDAAAGSPVCRPGSNRGAP